MVEIEVNKEMIINDACKVYEKYSTINSRIYYKYGKYKYKTVRKFFNNFVFLIQEVNKRMLNKNIIIKEDINKFVNVSKFLFILAIVTSLSFL